MSTTLSLPRSLINLIETKARRLGMSVEEYLTELLTQNLDPQSRAREYIRVARDLIVQAREELEKGSVRQAAEKLWGATSLAIKAYAAWREGKRLVSHGELWEYRRIVEKELGDWVYDAWMTAKGMHTCFYEGWCSIEDVEQAMRRIERLVCEVARKIEE